MKSLWRRLRVPYRIKRGRGQEEITSVQNICCMHGGELLKVWPSQVFNAIIFLEEIPNCLKTSPAYQTHLHTRVGKRPPAGQQLQRSSSFINYCQVAWIHHPKTYEAYPTRVWFPPLSPDCLPAWSFLWRCHLCNPGSSPEGKAFLSLFWPWKRPSIP